MKVFLTGGAGYVGSAALRWLLAHGHDALAYDDLSHGNRAAVPSDMLVVGDIRDRAQMASLLRDFGADAVMHFAALASVPDSIADPDRYYEANVTGTKAVLDAMRDAGVKRIVFSSTAATFAFTNEMPLRETSATIPETPYGTTKLAGERMIADYARAYGMGYTIFRYFNACGADPGGQFGESRRHEGHLIPLTLMVALGKREKLKIFGNDYETRDGTCVRDYVHTQDLAQAHLKALERLRPGDAQLYNLGSGTGTTVLEILRACEEVVGKPIPHEFAPRRPGDPGTLIATPEKAIRELGWAPAFTDIKQIVQTAWDWHSTHPDGY